MDRETTIHDLLEHILLDENEEPTKLPMWLLESITKNFSEDMKIGDGGFAHVYKAVFRNHIVAVKKLKHSEKVDLQEAKFVQEVDSLTRVKHKNIVRFLGYCSDTQGNMQKHQGKNIMAEERQRFLCFEFMPKGSLDKYISDASSGLEWRMRYQIIKGICEGLHYLHQEKIVHSDLKPANILLDNNMEPKIADFGLAKCFDEEQTRAITLNVFGSLGYMAPECFSGVITFKSDIYSLGIIITEMLTGHKVRLQKENVLESWTARFQTLKEATWLEHVKVCAEIGLKCIKSDPAKRPMARDIIETLDKLEATWGDVETETHVDETDFPQMMGIHPLEVCFPFEPDKRINCTVSLTNTTDHHVGVWITPTYPDICSSLGFPYMWEKYYLEDKGSTLFRRLEPHSSMDVSLSMTERQQPPLQEETGMFEVVMIATEKIGTLMDCLVNGRTTEGLGTEMYRATLRAVVTCDPANCHEVVAHQLIQSQELCGFSSECIDVHPTETWVLVGERREYVSIWNYETQEKVVLKLTISSDERRRSTIKSIKFIAREQWFAAGDDRGSVHIYAYTTKDKVKEFEAHHRKPVEMLAAHPTDTLLLTASRRDNSIRLWDWGQGWTCTRVFEHGVVGHLKFGPKNSDDTFISHSSLQGLIKIWDIHSSDPITTLQGGEPTFYTDRYRHYRVAVRGTAAVQIWDFQARKLVHTLRHMETSISIESIGCHPTLPILATIGRPYIQTNDNVNTKHLYLWDTRTYRLNKRVEFSLRGIIMFMAFDGTEGLTRLVVASYKEIWTIKIDLPALLAGGGN